MFFRPEIPSGLCRMSELAVEMVGKSIHSMQCCILVCRAACIFYCISLAHCRGGKLTGTAARARPRRAGAADFLIDLECRRTLSSDFDDRPAKWNLMQACTIFVIFHAALQNSVHISLSQPSLLYSVHGTLLVYTTSTCTSIQYYLVDLYMYYR